MALLFFMKFDEGSGSAPQDASGNGFHGTFNGTPAWSTWNGRNVASFNGSSAIQLASNAILTSFTDLSIMLFINSSANTGFRTMVAFNNEDPGLFINADALRFYPVGGTASASVGTGAWKHVAVTKSGSTYRYYIDGVADPSNPITGTGGTVTPATANRTIASGNAAGSDESYTGLMSYLRIYDDTKSQADIQAIFAADTPGGGGASAFPHQYYQQQQRR